MTTATLEAPQLQLAQLNLQENLAPDAALPPTLQFLHELRPLLQAGYSVRESAEQFEGTIEGQSLALLEQYFALHEQIQTQPELKFIQEKIVAVPSINITDNNHPSIRLEVGGQFAITASQDTGIVVRGVSNGLWGTALLYGDNGEPYEDSNRKLPEGGKSRLANILTLASDYYSDIETNISQALDNRFPRFPAQELRAYRGFNPNNHHT